MRGAPGHKRGAGVSEKPKNFKGTVKRLFTFAKTYKIGLIFVLIFTVLGTVSTNLGPRILGYATNIIADGLAGGTGINFSQLMIALVFLGATYLTGAAFAYLQHFIITGVSQKTMYSLRKAVDEKIRRLPLKYFDSNSFGDVLSRVTNDVDTVSNSLQQGINQILTALLTIIIVMTMMISISPLMSLIAVLTMPFIILSSMGVIKRSQGLFRGQQESLGELNGHIEEMFTGHSVVKLYGREDAVIEEFDIINRKLYDYGWKSQFISGIIMPLMVFWGNLGYVFVTVAGGLLVISGKLRIGDIQSFIQYLRSFNQPLNQLSQIANILQSTTAAAERIFEFLDEEEEIPDTPTSQLPEMIEGNVRFHDVRFGYREDKILINNLNLNVSGGEKIAIVGPTGAGKTTLVNLLLRFYEVNSGKILIDGVDITQISRKDLRAMFGMVLQDTWLFKGTIMENIRYGRLEATDQEVIEAAKAAHADSFIRALPDGYNMVLSEDAANLSQGQRQLITIARAILSQPKILILDEATSSVDTRTEVLIQRAMETLMHDRTSFVIAHRLSTIRDASRILVLKDGDVIETGTHQELLSRGGFYTELYNAQFTKDNAV